MNSTFPPEKGFSLLDSLQTELEVDELDIPLPQRNQELSEEGEEPPLEPLTQSTSTKVVFDPDPNLPLFFTLPADGEQGFWRRESYQEMKEIWERDKVELTREWKRRHRDAKKQRRRRGGGGFGDDLE